MAFSTLAPMQALVTLLGGLSGMGDVQIGAPLSTATRVSAFVTVGAQPIARKATQMLWREAHYFVGLYYRVDGAETGAETDLANLLDAFILAVYADPTLGGTVTEAKVDASLADHPEYQIVVAPEFRVYPLIVTATQQQTVP